MSDASGEYKSDAFLRTLKDYGITVLQSVPYVSQQNGRAERFMHTIMDKAQAMCLEACLPQNQWEFVVAHATHCYNRTPMSCLKWCTPYELLNNEVPDISHLRVFGCGAYVHIPEAHCLNKLSPKSELMIYLGRPSGMKGDAFMRKSFVVFYSDTALFDEAMYPSCGSVRPKRTTRIDEPPSNQPDLSDDITIPGDSDDPPPEPKQERRAPQPDGVDEVPLEEPIEQHAPPDEPEPVPKPGELPAQPRRSGRIRRPPTRPDNVYGDKHPTKITKDIEWTHNWKHLVGDQPGDEMCNSRKLYSHWTGADRQG